jgi:hypothetical protein
LIERPCSVAVAVGAEPLGTVSWPITIGSAPPGPESGSIQKIAASYNGPSAALSVQVVKSKPGDAEMALGLEPSDMPTVIHESNSAAGMNA